MFWGGAVFSAGWAVRTVSSYDNQNLNLYIAQSCLIYGGPPIYSAAEYNVLGRMMGYLPMHAPINPRRVTYFFIYLGILVESLTAAGASTMAANQDDPDAIKRGGLLISVSLVLQGSLELFFITMVATIHQRAARANMLPRNVRNLCIMLYGTSSFIIFRCIFRAIESFSTMTGDSCNSVCHLVVYNEWYLYAFEAAPMVIYTIWLNIIHPGRLLPKEPNRYLDLDGKTERMGPGWKDHRSLVESFIDPFDFQGMLKGSDNHDKFWLEPEKWPIAEGSFTDGTASNVAGKKVVGNLKEVPSV
jgi:hypothetical protein